MKRLLFAAASLAACTAAGFHVQVGISGYSGRINDWYALSGEIGATAGRLGSEELFDNGIFGFILGGEKDVGALYPVTYGAKVLWNTPANPLQVTVEDRHNVNGSQTVAIGEAVNLPAFGAYAYMTDARTANGVLTFRGNPYSLVVNDTSKRREINGVQIEAGRSALLPFPIHLVTAEINHARFFDLAGGDEITPYTFPGGGIYADGHYTLSWTGDIRISDGTTLPGTYGLSPERMLFGDIDTDNMDMVLHAANGMPVRESLLSVTNLNLYVWWDFNQDDWGSPYAMINGECVCADHATGHIVAYSSGTIGLRVDEFSGKGRFTLQLLPKTKSGSCTMKVWGGAGSYADAAEGHRAQSTASNGGTGMVTFEVAYNMETGEWSIRAL